jgi:hypothetical protein
MGFIAGLIFLQVGKNQKSVQDRYYLIINSKNWSFIFHDIKVNYIII